MVYGRWHLNELFYSLFLFSSLHFSHLSYVFFYCPCVCMFVCVWVCEGSVARACKRTFKEGDECVKTSIKLSVFFCLFFIFNLKSLVILYFLDPPHKVFFYLFPERKGGTKMCRQQFGYQVLFSSVFLKPLIPVIILTLFFMQLLSSSTSLSIGSYSVCVYI